MNTFQEFMQHTKGVEYFLAITFLIGLCFFWRILDQKEDR